jgi:hypothetical protein
VPTHVPIPSSSGRVPSSSGARSASPEPSRRTTKAKAQRAVQQLTLLGASWHRFWTKVDTSGDCWEWTGKLNDEGYGQFRHAGENSAHRTSWVLHHGPITDGLWVLHHCDNRRCVRPDHLYLGTVQDNVRDAMSRDRVRRGPWVTNDMPVVAAPPPRPVRWEVNRWAETVGLLDARLALRSMFRATAAIEAAA